MQQSQTLIQTLCELNAKRELRLEYQCPHVPESAGLTNLGSLRQRLIRIQIDLQQKRIQRSVRQSLMILDAGYPR